MTTAVDRDQPEAGVVPRERLEITRTPDGKEHVVGVKPKKVIGTVERIAIGFAAVLAALGWGAIALHRGETINSVWLVLAAIGTYIIGFSLYARLVEYKVVKPRNTRATPAEYVNDGTDFVPTDRRVLFGHHFAAIAGAGPLVGPVMAAQMGYLPSTLWIIIGVVLAGAVQDYLVLAVSQRRRGRSLGQMLKEEVGRVGGIAGSIATMVIMVIIIAVLGLVVVNALAESPWGVFSIAMTIPIALFMGVYGRFLRPGRVAEVSAIGVVLLMAAILGGGYVAETSWGAELFTLSKSTLAVCILIYGVIASVLPVWLLLAPRDYLSTFMKVGVIVMLALAILIDRPEVHMPAVTVFGREGGGPVFSGTLFPFLFITIACGALSGFHALISSGTTPKLLEKETHARAIGYGGMLMESFVAIMALITAVVLDRHIYFAINSPKAKTGGEEATAAEFVNGLNIPGQGVSAEQLTALAEAVGEPSIVSRTGGAPTFAIGMSEIMTNIVGHPGMQAFWYHFAIMFEGLFILTAIDAGTRVARFMMGDMIGNISGLEKFKDPSWRVGSWISTVLVCGMWGAILVMGVTDPLGGINVLFPLFGIANQLLAAIALCLVTAIVFKKGLFKWAWIPLVPLVWDLIVTMTASWQKIFSDDPAIGYFAQHSKYKEARDQGLEMFQAAKSPEEIDIVVRNTMIQGILSVFFAALVIIVVVATVVVCVRAVQAHKRGEAIETHEEPEVPSTLFTPRGMLATAEEKAVAKEYGLELNSPPGTGH